MLALPTLRLVSQTDTAIALEWTNPNANTGTEVQRSSGAGFVTVARPAKRVLAWTDTALPVATTVDLTVTYRVRVRGPHGTVSGWSNSVATIITAAQTQPPPPPPPFTCTTTIDGDFTSVSNAVAAAANGDVICLNAGSWTWTTTLTITKPLTLYGAGIGQTIINDGVPKGTASCAGGFPLLTMQPAGTDPWRISNFTIQGSVLDSNKCEPGHFNISGGSHAFRVDHVFIECYTTCMLTNGDLWGVIDHCTFSAVDHPHQIMVQVRHASWQGQGSFGDNSWATPDTMGTAQNLFIEDSTFIDSSASGAGATDIIDGGRLVFRHNTAPKMGSHGTETTQRHRSLRHVEVYNNTFNAGTQSFDTLLGWRGGTGLVYNNTLTGDFQGALVKFQNFRDSEKFNWAGNVPGWGACGGDRAWETLDNGGAAYVTSTVTAGGTNTFTDATQDFTTACGGSSCAGSTGRPFTLRNLTQNFATAITSVTPTTVTLAAKTQNSPLNYTVAVGDSYTIVRTYPCLDQVGRGPGDLISGATPTPADLHQTAMPVYLWQNTLNGATSPTSRTNAGYHILVGAGGDVQDNTVKPGWTPYTYPHPLNTG